MIAFLDGGGNISVIGNLSEWIALLKRLQASRLEIGEPASAAQYLLTTAESVTVPDEPDGDYIT